MNLSRGWLLMGTPRRLAPASLTVAFCSLALHAAPASWADPPRGPQALEADVLPGNDSLAPPDLGLHGDAENKADALAAFSQAIVAEDNGDSDTALLQYQKALSLDPGYTELAVKVAFELARRGDPSAGIQVLKDNIKASPKAPLSYLYLSQLYLKYLGKPEVGLKYAQQALALDPSNLASYIAVYEIDMATSQPLEAAKILDRAAASGSTDPQFWLQLGDAMLKSCGDGQIPADRQPKIAAVFHKALALSPNDPATLARVGDFYSRTGQEKEAIPLYLKAIKLSPANPPEGDQTLSGIRDNLARCLAAVGRDTDAIATLQQLIKDDPLRTDAYGPLCELYEKSGQYEAAYAICQQMILLDPNDFRNVVQAAQLLMLEKKTEAAIDTLTEARMKFPAEAEITYVLGLALSDAKRYPESLAMFEQAEQEATEGETEMLNARFFYMYSAAADQAGQHDKAMELLKKSIELDPKFSMAYNDLGFMWVDRGIKLDEAGTLIRKALELDPDNPAFIDSLGWYYYKKGQFKQAVETLKKAASLIQPEDAIVDEHLGDAYNASNDTTHALDYWQRAAGIDKDNKELAVKIAGARQKLAREGPAAQPPP